MQYSVKQLNTYSEGFYAFLLLYVISSKNPGGGGNRMEKNNKDRVKKELVMTMAPTLDSAALLKLTSLETMKSVQQGETFLLIHVTLFS